MTMLPGAPDTGVCPTQEQGLEDWAGDNPTTANQIWHYSVPMGGFIVYSMVFMKTIPSICWNNAIRPFFEFVGLLDKKVPPPPPSPDEEAEGMIPTDVTGVQAILNDVEDTAAEMFGFDTENIADFFEALFTLHFKLAWKIFYETCLEWIVNLFVNPDNGMTGAQIVDAGTVAYAGLTDDDPTNDAAAILNAASYVAEGANCNLEVDHNDHTGKRLDIDENETWLGLLHRLVWLLATAGIFFYMGWL